jgi:hypothetical protein
MGVVDLGYMVPEGNVFDFAAERAWRKAREESGIIFDDAPPIDTATASEESPVSHADLLDAGVIDDSKDPLIDFGSVPEE